MGSDWPEVKLGNSCSKIASGATPKGGASAYLTSGKYFLIRSQNIYNDNFNQSGLVFISEEAAEKLKNVIVEEQDVLLNITGDSVARVCLAKRDFLPARVNQHVLIIRPNKQYLDSRFLRYYLSSPKIQSHLLTLASAGATRNALTKGMLESLNVPSPPLSLQASIANILSEFDNKIALNRQINQTLEKMAQALFKSWFIDFDPVIDNAIAAGNPVPEPFKARAAIRQKIQQTGEFKPLDKDTLALFPAEFEQSELGWVPKGWKSESLYNLAEYVNGAAYKKFEPNERKEGLPIIKIAELKSGISEKTSYSVIQMPIKYLLANKDILFSWSGNPDTSIDTFVWSLGSAWLNQHIFKVIPKKSIGYSFILQTLKYMKPIFSNIARDKQTTGLGHVTVKDLKRLHIPIPQEAILTYFETTLSATIERAFGNQISIQTLTALRDTLLPKLISGELKLPDNL